MLCFDLIDPGGFLHFFRLSLIAQIVKINRFIFLWVLNYGALSTHGKLTLKFIILFDLIKMFHEQIFAPLWNVVQDELLILGV